MTLGCVAVTWIADVAQPVRPSLRVVAAATCRVSEDGRAARVRVCRRDAPLFADSASVVIYLRAAWPERLLAIVDLEPHVHDRAGSEVVPRRHQQAALVVELLGPLFLPFAFLLLALSLASFQLHGVDGVAAARVREGVVGWTAGPFARVFPLPPFRSSILEPDL